SPRRRSRRLNRELNQGPRRPPSRRRSRQSSSGAVRLRRFQMQIGDYVVEVIQDAEFRLDGGAMFGVVPRQLWSQVCPPDDENRIRMNMNCVFIDTGVE